MKLGIVGLPNVGKSTLFNAITNAGAQSANFPFCTIDPNVGVVAVPDKRLDALCEMYTEGPIVFEFLNSLVFLHSDTLFKSTFMLWFTIYFILEFYSLVLFQ